MMWAKLHFTSVLFLLQTYNLSLITRKTKQVTTGDILQDIYPVLLKTVKVIKNKEKLKNCYSQEEP